MNPMGAVTINRICFVVRFSGDSCGYIAASETADCSLGQLIE